MIDPTALRQRRERIQPPPQEPVVQTGPKDFRKGGGGSGVGFGIVRCVEGNCGMDITLDPNGDMILVTPAEEKASDETGYRMKALDSKTTKMKTWPGLLAADYRAFVFTGGPNAECPFLMVVRLGNEFYVGQFIPKWDLQIPAPNVDFSDCTPTTRY